MTAGDEAIYIGGLLRCCYETLMERTEPAADGDVQLCRWCSSGAVFRAQTVPGRPGVRGAWHWKGTSTR